MYEITPEETSETPKKSSFKDGLGKMARVIYDIVETLVIAIAIVVFVYLFVASPHEVIGRSMEDNFWNGEYLLADKVSYHLHQPEQGDVIIFKHTDTADYIKRVIGVPGDTVEVRDGYFYVNGKRLIESEYLESDVYTSGGNYLSEGEVITIQEGTIFVAGDNRPHSSDSRAFGPIDLDTVKGRAVLIYWPFSRLEVVDKPTYNQ